MRLKIPSYIPESVQYDIKSIREEVANMLSHGLGLLMAAVAVPFLLYYAYLSGKSLHLLGATIYSVSLLMVYFSSTLYHSSYSFSVRKFFRTMDHISIYFLIAGSYTPFILSHLQTSAGWTVFIILWATTAVGTIFKIFFVHKFKIVSTIAYLSMGWMAVFIFKSMVEALPPESIQWIIIGGLSYTLGSIFYLWNGLKYNHFIWHLFVLGGSVGHFIAVYFAISH
jgi:hemolysin III